MLSIESPRWGLEVEEALFDSANQPTTVQMGDQVMNTFSPDPSLDVLDTMPRTVGGLLDDGRAVTLFDAQETGTGWDPFGSKKQRFGGWRVLFGALLSGLDAPVAGVRWTLPRWPGLRFNGEASCRGGSLASYTHDEHPGICLILDRPEPVGRAAEMIPHRISTLLTIASGAAVEPVHREVLLPDGTWATFGADRPSPTTHISSDLVAPAAIDLPAMAAWTDESGDLGPLPFIVASALTATLQSDAQSLAAALEGLHRRLHRDKKPFATVSRKGLRRAVLAAANAGANQLAMEGWTDTEFARSRFEQSLNHVGQMSYADRLSALLEPVACVAPGLFGPHLDVWVRNMSTVRNVQSHQLTEHDDFGEQEIALYFVLGQSAAWALRIALLARVFPEEALRTGLKASSRFAYTLANIDAEQVWSGYSCSAAFRQSTLSVATPPESH